MAGRPGGEPLSAGRGLLRVEDFCLSTGLDQATVEGMLADVEGVYTAA